MLQVHELTKAFRPARKEKKPPVKAVDGVTFDIPKNEFFTLLGPSGCGKSTTLRCIAGLERADDGEITVGEVPRVLFSRAKGVDVAANDRGLGMVFQSYAIWPHMNVFKNIAFPLTVQPRSRRPTRREIKERVERVLSVMELEGLAYRPSTALSGGQQQRLALGRALVMEPEVLLLDEPLSNLDAKLREGMRLELRRVQQELGITTIYVTHDQVEALAMSNRVAVMKSGAIEQVGAPREIYESPSSYFVADFIGSSNFVEGTVETRTDGGRYVVRTVCGRLEAQSQQVLETGAAVSVGIRPEHIVLTPRGDPSRAGGSASTGVDWFGTAVARNYLGEFVEHLVMVDDVELRVRTGADSLITEGATVRLHIPASACLAFSRITEPGPDAGPKDRERAEAEAPKRHSTVVP